MRTVCAISKRDAAERGTWQLEAKMGEVIQFISKAERERLRLIREARAIYDGVFPTDVRSETVS